MAPNAFKGSLTAERAASAIADGVRIAMPGAVVDLLPLADGGDGSVAAFVSAGYRPEDVPSRGPTGRPEVARIAISGTTAVVEIANSCGLLLLPDGLPEPLLSSSTGLGDAILGGIDHGARHIIVCLGGSASTDGGAGMLASLGAVLRDDAGEVVPGEGGALPRVATLDLRGLDPRLSECRFTVASDVVSPLLGEKGAAAVFGPQKGATPAEVDRLDEGLRHWAGVLAGATGRPVADIAGAGAAGGTAAALLAVLDARQVSGAELIAETLGLPRRLEDADAVITGEGHLDSQSLLGKGAMSVVAAAAARGIPVILCCGQIDLDADLLESAGVTAAASIGEIADDATDAMDRAPELLAAATALALRRWNRG